MWLVLSDDLLQLSSWIQCYIIYTIDFSLPFVCCFVWYVPICVCLYKWMSVHEFTIACIWWLVDNLSCGPCLPPCWRKSTLFLLYMPGSFWVCRNFPFSTSCLTMESYYRCMLPFPVLWECCDQNSCHTFARKHFLYSSMLSSHSFYFWIKTSIVHVVGS